MKILIDNRTAYLNKISIFFFDALLSVSVMLFLFLISVFFFSPNHRQVYHLWNHYHGATLELALRWRCVCSCIDSTTRKKHRNFSFHFLSFTTYTHHQLNHQVADGVFLFFVICFCSGTIALLFLLKIHRNLIKPPTWN